MDEAHSEGTYMEVSSNPSIKASLCCNFCSETFHEKNMGHACMERLIVGSDMKVIYKLKILIVSYVMKTSSTKKNYNNT